MITKLTKSQEQRLLEIRDEWISKGLTTNQPSVNEARKIVRDFDLAFFKKERPVLYLSSPLGCWLGVLLFSTKSKQVGQQVGQQVRQQVRQQVWQQVEQQVEQQVADFVWPYLSGHFWASYFGWIRAHESIGVTGIPKSYAMLEPCSRLGLFFPLEDIFIVGSPPSKLRLSEGRLHKDEAPAIEYADGWKLYFLKGVPMLPEQVLTPAEKLTPDQVLKETNADRRRELIRKVGIERMLSKLSHKSMDKRGDYELLSIRLSDEVSDARYLRMLNPSVGVFHLEGVDPSCKTVTESLNWRNSNWHESAEVLT